MRLSSLFTIVGTFFVAALLSLVAANLSVKLIEESSEIGVRDALDDTRHDMGRSASGRAYRSHWPGSRPPKPCGFPRSRPQEQWSMPHASLTTCKLPPPPPSHRRDFSAEILRNDAGLSIIGLIPATTDREAVQDFGCA